MTYIITLLFLVVPIVMALKGKCFRGLWAGLAVAGVSIGVLFNGMFYQVKGAEGKRMIVAGQSVENVLTIAKTYDSLSFIAFAFAVGCFFAACFHRNKQSSEIVGTRKDSPAKNCPYCAEEIKFEAVVCRYCGKDLPADSGPTMIGGIVVKE